MLHSKLYDNMKKLFSLWLLCSCMLTLSAQTTQTIMLSGSGFGHTVAWDFYCSAGMNSEKWGKINVPSQWELEGYGAYTYGRFYIMRQTESKETGTYKRTFTLPELKNNEQVNLVFEGVMIDTDVKINGQSAGATHQGGFYRFSYDITSLVKTGENEIEVFVKKVSDNASINNAERKADWWDFGGIYRPVYLQIKPQTHIERIAVDARADGSLNAQVFVSPLPEGYSIATSVRPLAGGKALAQRIQTANAGDTCVTVVTRWNGIKAWNPEDPNLYVLKVSILNAKKKVVHEYEERIGFRTIEFRKRDGIYVNGTRVVLKGINRHSFWPDGGRCTNKEISLNDVLLLKEMHVNAIRVHYPPDVHFLDMCDSLGLFVVDELAGWQNPYDNTVGYKIQKEMVTRDVNHPCVIIWSNGNEGGWNKNLDDHFADYDPQKRHVIHAWADFNDLDTHHYPTFYTGIARFTYGYKLFMPTEFMHGLYDQGHGSGLEDFWNKYKSHPLFVGGFMWDFSDNAVKRVDLNGQLDSDGSNGADGIVGPYREKEGSVYTVRDIWAPIQFDKIFITPSFDGSFTIGNEYLYTNLSTCKMSYTVYQIPTPLTPTADRKVKSIATGSITLPALNPREKGKATFKLPENFFEGDVLEVKAWDKFGKEICTWTWTIKYADEYWAGKLPTAKTSGEQTQLRSTDSTVTLTSPNGVSIAFNKLTGMIKSVSHQGKVIPFNGGPVPVGMKATVRTTDTGNRGKDAYFTVRYTGGVDSIQWVLTSEGLLSMKAVMLNNTRSGTGFDDATANEQILNLGLTFSYPEDQMQSMQWFGRGPYRVWKNRIRGANFGMWSKDYNNTITGSSFESLIYPEFKGYHGNMYWVNFIDKTQPFSVYSESDGVYFRVFTPHEPSRNISGWRAYPEFPSGDISFLYEIPGMRCFKPINHHGPESQPGSIRIKIGDEGIKMNLWFDFR